MRHQNSVLHALLKQVPWSAFDRLMDEHGADRRVRRLSTKSQFVALLYGQFGGAASLREEERAVDPATAILSDRVGFLPARQAKSRANPFADPVREIRVRLETGTVLRIVSNDLDAGAEEIAALYRRRRQVELFFR